MYALHKLLGETIYKAVLTLLYALQMLLMMKANASKQSWTSCATKPDAMPSPWLSTCRAVRICQPLKICPCMMACKATRQPQCACQMSLGSQYLLQVNPNHRKGRIRVRGRCKGRGRCRCRGRARVRGTARDKGRARGNSRGSPQAGAVRQSWQQWSKGCQCWSSRLLQPRSGTLLKPGSAMVCNQNYAHMCMYATAYSELSALLEWCDNSLA